MDLEFAGDVAVVVGGARGLGHAIGRAFLAEGARVRWKLSVVGRVDAEPGEP